MLPLVIKNAMSNHVKPLRSPQPKLLDKSIVFYCYYHPSVAVSLAV